MSSVQQNLTGLPRRISHLLWTWEERTPDAPALRQGDQVLTFRELAEAVRGAQAMLADLGVRPGDRLMLVNENCIELCVLILAATDMDAWAAVINARLSPREIDAIRDHCGARRVIYTVAVSKDAAQHAERHGAVGMVVPGLGPVAVGPINTAAVSEPVETDAAGQVAVLIYTSGTTGTPKGVMLTHRNIAFIATVSGRQRGLVADDVVYAVLPMSHVFGMSSVFMGTLAAGACLLLAPRFAPEQVVEDLAHGMTVLQGVPAMYAKLLEHVRTQGISLDGHRLRYLSAGGSPLDAAIKAETEGMFGLALNNGYGLTEAGPTIAQTRIDEPRADCSVGPALPGVEVRIVNSDGRDVPAGEVGELWVRGPGVMKGYYRAADLTAQVINAQGWLNTGDFARLGADGSLFIVGRSKELIIRSGFNVYPAEVEAVLNAHPEVTQSAVVGRVLADGNEDVVAFVQLTPGAAVTVDDLGNHAAGQLAPYKRPSEIVVMENLPAGATGKILKNRLAEMAKSRSY